MNNYFGTCFFCFFSGLIALISCLFTVENIQAQTHYEIVILAGQSNAVGAAGATNLNDLTAPLDAPQPDVLFFSNGGGSLSGPTDLQPGSGTGEFGFGPEVSFGRAVADARPNQNLAIVKHAVSATDLMEDWDPDTGNIYAQMLNTVNRATNSISGGNDTYEIVGFLWVQGEGDANRNYGSLYNANLTNLISEVRSEFGADMPFFISFLSDNQVYGANADDDLVRQAQLDVAAADDNTFLIDTNGPEFVINPFPDNLHYTSEGQVVLGQALADSFLAVTSNSPTPMPMPTPTETEGIIFQEDFDGAVGAGLDGTSPTIGTGTWSAASGFNADGTISLSGNSSASISIGDVINDAAGTPNGLFELSATLAPTVGTGNNWYSLGFSQLATPNNGMHFLNSNDGLGSILLRSNTEIDMFAGNGFTPNGMFPAGNTNLIDGPTIGPNTTEPRVITIEIDLRNANGIDDFGTVTYFDSSQVDPEIGSFTYTNEAVLANTGELGNTPEEPEFNTIMLSGNSPGGLVTGGTYSSLTLTQIGSSVLVCDVNMDGMVNFLDISPFISALADPAFNPEADCNEDGVDSFLDIAPFIMVLAGGS